MTNKPVVRKTAMDILDANGLTFERVAAVLDAAMGDDNPSVRLAAIRELRAWTRQITEDISKAQKEAAMAGVDDESACERQRELQSQLKAVGKEELIVMRERYVAGE